MGAFIDDGQTAEGYIKASPKAEFDYDAIEFTYRPATAGEETALQQGREQILGEQRALREAEFIAKHVVSWNLRTGSGAPVAISRETCLRLKPYVSSRLLGIITGWNDSDPKPDGSIPVKPNAGESLGN